MRKLPITSDEERIRLIADLLQLRRDGHFHALWVNDYQIRVQYAADQPTKLLSWRRAKKMVATAREAAVALLYAEASASRKPPKGERLERAARTKTPAV